MAVSHQTVSAVVTAGDTRASKAIYGQSKVYLPVAGRPMVVGLVIALQDVPEVAEVWVVGDRSRLTGAFDDPVLRAEIRKPLHLVEQGRDLLENAWETYRKVLSQDLETGRDPVGDEMDLHILFLSADMPFATPEELSVFVRSGLARQDCDYTLGLVPEHSLADFLPPVPGQPGIEVAFFNIREGRLRQSNLHLARPARIGNLYRIEEIYELRHQRKFLNMVLLALKLFFSEVGGPRIFLYYMMMHAAGLADRWRLRWLADRLRGAVTLERIERMISSMLDTRFRFLVTEAGGCAVDVDTEQEYDVVCERYEELWAAQRERAEKLYGRSSVGPRNMPPTED